MRNRRFARHRRLLGTRPRRKSVNLVGPALVSGLLLVTPAASAHGEDVVEDESQSVEPGVNASENEFVSMSLEELMNVSVTSVLGTEDTWFSTPAALTLITNEDLRRTGHRSIAEALRLVPGFSVVRIDSHNWAISSRGFTGQFANKLQVLRDGRRLYDPLFSGVYWDVQHYPLEDVDRIEVIRGPGATLWGANAVNGVINITTKSAADTQGLYMTGGGGTYHQGFGAIRYGDALADDAFYRVYGSYQNNDNFADIAGGRRPDDWSFGQGGFRFDFGTKSDTKITVQGDAYYTDHLGEASSLAIPTVHFGSMLAIGDVRASGANILLKLDHKVSETEGWTLQAYYDRFNRAVHTDFEYLRNSVDVDFRHRFRVGDRHQIIWGLNYRHDRDDIRNGSAPTFSITPAERSLDTFSAFIQDTILLVPDRLFGMIGSKFEHNDFTGFEIQPSARLWWTPDDTQTLWSAVSRPVRTPSRVEDDSLITFAFADPGLLAGGPPAGFLIPLSIMGHRGVESETVLTYELGYRRKLTDSLTVDVAGHYSEYDDFVAVGPTGLFDNLSTAEAYGLEVASTWEVADNWRVKGSYTFLRTHLHGVEFGEGGESSHAQQQFQLQSYLDITDDLEFNAALYYVDNIPALMAESYVRLDLGLTWRPTPNLELALWGQNLLDPDHPESRSSLLSNSPAAVERNVYLQATLRF